MNVPRWVAEGLKGFPECAECQCYPECRIDCPEHLKCLEKLPEYKNRAYLPPAEEAQKP